MGPVFRCPAPEKIRISTKLEIYTLIDVSLGDRRTECCE